MNILIFKNRLAVLGILICLAFINLGLFGFNPAPPSGDSVDYNAYAKNLALGNGYTDGSSFSTYREPGYPFLISLIYKIFGIENFMALKIIQTLFLALTAFVVYLVFDLYDRKNIGLIAALLTAAIPSYGFYASHLNPELPFALLLILSLYLVLRICRNEESLLFYGITGAVFAGAVLTRSFLVFLPFLIGLGFQFILHKKIKNIVIFCLAFLLLISSWVSYVHHKTGVWAITQGRVELHLYARAARSKLSYKKNVSYLYSWIRRSALGGEGDKNFTNYEIWTLIKNYGDKTGQGYPAERIKTESVATILNNPGHYLFGNFIEMIKLVFIEHLYPPVSALLNRYVRAIFYASLYGLFTFGSIQFLKHRGGELRPIFWLASMFLLYNWIVMSFFDAIPRFNTPYLVFYLLIGIAGLASMSKPAIQST